MGELFNPVRQQKDFGYAVARERYERGQKCLEGYSDSLPVAEVLAIPLPVHRFPQNIRACQRERRSDGRRCFEIENPPIRRIDAPDTASDLCQTREDI